MSLSAPGGKRTSPSEVEVGRGGGGSARAMGRRKWAIGMKACGLT